jgi:hypothetical protein
VYSCISRASKCRLPLTSTGYFSDQDNLAHFTECAETYVLERPGVEMDSGNNEMLRLLFGTASQLGIFKATTKKLSWPENFGP